MGCDWQDFAACRAKETSALAEQILQITKIGGIWVPDIEALLAELHVGSSALEQLVAGMRAQSVDSRAVELIAALHVTWLQMVDVVERHRRVTAAFPQPPRLRLVHNRAA
jgi:hypothetical protein